MRDPELLAHLMAELTGRLEDLAAEAAGLQDPRRMSESALRRFCASMDQVRDLCAAARILASG